MTRLRQPHVHGSQLYIKCYHWDSCLVFTFPPFFLWLYSYTHSCTQQHHPRDEFAASEEAALQEEGEDFLHDFFHTVSSLCTIWIRSCSWIVHFEIMCDDGAQFTRGSFTRYHTPPLFCAQQKLGRKWQGKKVTGEGGGVREGRKWQGKEGGERGKKVTGEGGGGERLRSIIPTEAVALSKAFLVLPHNWSSHTHYCMPTLTIRLHCGWVDVGSLPSFVNNLIIHVIIFTM